MVEYHASKAVGEFKLAAEYISPDMAPTFEDTDCSLWDQLCQQNRCCHLLI